MEKVLFFENQKVPNGSRGRKPLPYAIMVQNTHSNGLVNTRKIATAATKQELKTKIREFEKSMNAGIEVTTSKFISGISTSKPKAKVTNKKAPVAKKVTPTAQETMSAQ